jgi:soluble lytic murein transglycosylase
MNAMWRLSFSACVTTGALLGLPGSVIGPTATPVAAPRPAAVSAGTVDSNRPALRPTAHPPVPRDLEALWLVPNGARPGSLPPAKDPASRELGAAVDLIVQERFADALPRLKQAAAGLSKSPLGDYAAYYLALAQLRTGAPAAAREGFRRLSAATVPGVLGEWALLGEAMASEQLGEPAEAMRVFAIVAERKPEKPDEVLVGLGRNQLASGARQQALATFRQLYFGFPSSPQAEEARQQMATLTGVADAKRLEQDFALELGRAERLFGARRYAEALTSFEAIGRFASGDDAEKVQLRIAESQYYLGRHRQALDGARPFVGRAARKAEARFFVASALRGLGERDAYVAEVRKLVEDFPENTWAEEALNNLATHYILADEDPAAAETFAQYLDKFPRGKYAPRAAWKLGWWRYRQADNDAAIAIFERAAATFSRSDYRPMWLYWAAKAYERLNERDLAAARYTLVSTDYLHSYYGRLADEQLQKRAIGPDRRAALLRIDLEVSGAAGEPSALTPTQASDTPSAAQGPAGAAPVGLPPTAPRIRQLVAARLYSTATEEVRYAQRAFGRAPALDATLAWLYQAQGDYRAGINAMKRAYPQYLSEDGSLMPAEALRIIFPLDYWDLIRKHAAARGLDPFLVAALVAQESSFDAAVRSSANAYGLMQIVPATGKRLARTLGIRRFSTSTLTNPETNVRLGTLYFKNLVAQFGGTHYALASYNAGESRVVRWISERGELPRDEFIDDIPFPETQNYVKKILGTAEDYRRLYGARAPSPPRGGAGD